MEYLLDRHMESIHGVCSSAILSPKKQPPQLMLNNSFKSPFKDAGAANLQSKCNTKASEEFELLHTFNFPPICSNPGAIKCNICDKKCDNVKELAEHKLQHCKVVHAEICSVCKEVINAVELFYNHTRLHNMHGIPVSCVVCRQTLISSVELQAHAKFHLRLAVKRCSVCNRQFDSLAGSLQSGSGELCGNCIAQSEESVEMQISVTKQKADDAIRCEECGVKFESSEELKVYLLY